MLLNGVCNTTLIPHQIAHAEMHVAARPAVRARQLDLLSRLGGRGDVLYRRLHHTVAMEARLGRIDERGYVHIVGRGKDLIIAGGSESMSRAPFVMPKATEAFPRTRGSSLSTGSSVRTACR